MKRPARGLICEQHTVRMAGKMTARIPATLGKIQPADKGQGIVDDNHFLMMGGPDRMRGELRREPPFPLLPVNHVEVPREDIDMELSSPDQQRMEEFA